MKARLCYLMTLCFAVAGAADEQSTRRRRLASVNGYFFTRNRAYVRTRQKENNVRRKKPRFDVTIVRNYSKSRSSGCQSGKAKKKKTKTSFLDAVDSMINDDKASSSCSSSKGKGKKSKGTEKEKKCKSSRGKGKRKKSSSSSKSKSKKGKASSKYCEPTVSPSRILTTAPMVTSMPIVMTISPVATNAPVLVTSVPITVAPTARLPEPVLPTNAPTALPTNVPTASPIIRTPETMLPTRLSTTDLPTASPIPIPQTNSPTIAPSVQLQTTDPTRIPTLIPTTNNPTAPPTVSSTTVETTMMPSSSSNTMMPTVESNVSPFRLDYFVNNANPADFDQIQQITRDYLDRYLEDQFMFSFVFAYDGLTMVASNTMSDPGIFMANFENVQVSFSSTMQPTQADLDVLISSAFASPAVDDLISNLLSSGTSFASTTDVGYVRL